MDKPNGPLAYALIAQFLENNGHTRTLNAFLSECDYIFNNDQTRKFFSKPPETCLMELIDKHVEDQLKEKMIALKVEQHQDDALKDPGDGHFPQKLGQTFDGIHSCNIIGVRLHVLPFPSSFLDSHSDAKTCKPVSVIVTAAADRTVKISSATNGEVLSTCDHHKGPVLCFDFHPEFPRLMATGSMDGYAMLVDAVTGRVRQKLKDHQKYVSRMYFTSDGEYLVTGSYDKTVAIYQCVTRGTTGLPIEQDWVDAEEAGINPSDWPWYKKVHQISFSGYVEALAIMPNTHIVVCGIRDDNNLHYVNLETLEDQLVNMNDNGDQWGRCHPYGFTVSFSPLDISPSPNGNYLLVTTSSPTGRLILFASYTARQVRNFYDPSLSANTNIDLSSELGQPRSLWHPSGAYIYATSGARSIKVFSVATGECIAELLGHKGIVRCMWFEPGASPEAVTGASRNDRLVTCSYDQTVRFWEVEHKDTDMVGL